MATLDPAGPNAEQIRYWNDLAGPKWVTFQQRMNGHIGPLGRKAMDRAAVQSGERILDVGCGCGDTTLELARRVGPSGSVTGIDISTIMLEQALAAARTAHVDHVHFENADAQTYAVPKAAFDLLFSRFGVMFFTDPVTAFANLQSALRAGGRLAFVCWQSLQDNPWACVPLMAALPHIQLPPPPASDAPGPFSFADPDRVRGILTRAGFVDVALEALNGPLTVGGGGAFEDTVQFILQIGPTGSALRDADAATRAAVADAIRATLAPYQTPAGVQLDSAAWIVSARRV
jgi:SAM-dependent methyltransferase